MDCKSVCVAPRMHQKHGWSSYTFGELWVLPRQLFFCHTKFDDFLGVYWYPTDIFKILMKIWLISTCSGLYLPFSINWLSIAVAFCPTNFSWKASPITKNAITPHGTVLRWPVHYSLHIIGTVYIPHIFWFNYKLMLVSFYFCLVSIPTENSPSGISGNRYIHQFLLPLAINKKHLSTRNTVTR